MPKVLISLNNLLLEDLGAAVVKWSKATRSKEADEVLSSIAIALSLMLE